MARQKSQSQRRKRTPNFVPWIVATCIAVGILILLLASRRFSLFRSSSLNSDTIAAATPTPFDFRYRYDQRRTGFSTSADITSTPTLLWKFKCPGGGTVNQAPPSISANTVFFMCGGGINQGSDTGEGIYALDITTGKQKWRVKGSGQSYCTGEGFYNPSRMEQVGGTLYTYACRNVVAINIADGTFRWTPKKFQQNYFPIVFSAPIATTGLSTNRVYYSTYKAADPLESYVSAINRANGSLLWERRYAGISFQDIVSGLDFSKLVLAGGSRDGNHPTATARVQILGNTDTTSPTQKWPSPRDFSSANLPYSMYGPVSLVNGAVYVGDNSGKIRALDKDNGNDIWPTHYFQVPGTATLKPVSQHMTAGKKLVVFADTLGNIYAINNDETTSGYGTQKWKSTYGPYRSSTIAPSISMTNGIVYIGNSAGEIKALRVSDGTLKWTLGGTRGTADACSQGDDVWEVTIVPGGRLAVQNDCGLLRFYSS